VADTLREPPGERDPAGIRVFVLPTEAELARAVAGRLWGIARERAAAGPVHIGLSGGRTPRGAYETLAAEPYRTRFPWEAVHFWQVDERFVAPSDPRSNRRMIEESFLSRVPVPPGRFHAVDTALPDPTAAAKAYENELRQAFAAAAPKIPRFDAVLLGIGGDGHTASLFPGAAPSAPEEPLFLAAEGGDPALPRVTMSLRLLNAAARILFVVQGGEKAEVLRNAVAAARDPARRSPSFPASTVAPPRGIVVFLVDGQAAALLPASWRTAG
jgi:6-phosphogluconolactonase